MNTHQSKIYSLILLSILIPNVSYADDEFVDGLPCNGLCRQWLGGLRTDLAQPPTVSPNLGEATEASEPYGAAAHHRRVHRAEPSRARLPRWARSARSGLKTAKLKEPSVHEREALGPAMPPKPPSPVEAAPAVQPVRPASGPETPSVSAAADKQASWKKAALSIFDATNDPVVVPFKTDQPKPRRGRHGLASSP